MENKDLKEAGKVVLTDEELMEIVGGTGTVDQGQRLAEYCARFDNSNDCISSRLCQWNDNYNYIKCGPHPRAYKLLSGGVSEL